MKRELTLTDIAGYLPYGLKVVHANGRQYGVFDIEVGKRRTSDGLCYYLEENEVPILRPMSDLYVEITERGYNNGKPFVPIIRLAKIKYPEFANYTFCNQDAGGEVYMSGSDSPITGWYEYDDDNLSMMEFDLLHRLKFDYRGLIDVKLAVSVHDLPTNPYEQ